MTDPALVPALAALAAAINGRPTGCTWPKTTLPLDLLPPSVSRGTLHRLAREGLVAVANTSSWVHPGPAPAHKLRGLDPGTPEGQAWVGSWDSIWDRIDRLDDCPYVLRLTVEGQEAATPPPPARRPDRMSNADLCKYGNVQNSTLQTIRKAAGVTGRVKGQGYTLDEVQRMLAVDAIAGKVSEDKLSTFRSGIRMWLGL